MPNVRPLLFTLLPLFAGCQLFQVYVPPTPATPAVRLQGELTLEQDRLLLRPCGEQRRLGLVSEKTGELRRDVDSLRADGQSNLFVDLRGWPQGSQQADLDGEVRLDQVYRVQGEGPGCDEPGFDRLLLVRAARQVAILPADRAALPQLQALYGVRLQAVELGEGQWATVVRPEAGADIAAMNDRAAP